MHSSRIKQTVSHTSGNHFTGNIFQYIPHGFTGPNAILAHWSFCQNFTNPKISDFAACALLASSTHASYPVQEPLCINTTVLVTARYIRKLVEKIKRGFDLPLPLFRTSCT